jgi:hypothetical protein
VRSKGGHVLPGDRSQYSIEFSHLGDSRTRRVRIRRFNRRGCEVAKLREALTVKPSPQLHVEGAIPVLPDRVWKDLKGRVGGFKSRTREIARLS